MFELELQKYFVSQDATFYEIMFSSIPHPIS